MGRPAGRRVPAVAAVLPWQLRSEGGGEVVERVGDDDVVIGGHEEGDNDCRDTGAYKRGKYNFRKIKNNTLPDEIVPDVQYLLILDV